MEYEKLLDLIKTVSNSNISSFQYEDKDMKVDLNTRNESLPESGIQVQPIIENIMTEDKEAKYVTSPLVGTFYKSPSENGEPFVSVGDHVTKGQTVAIVEAMKLMNEVECEWDGVIKKVLVQDGETVEYGQPLFQIG